MRIVFMGTPQISANTLEALINEGYNVVGIVSQPDRPVGRKSILEKTDKEIAYVHKKIKTESDPRYITCEKIDQYLNKQY